MSSLAEQIEKLHDVTADDRKLSQILDSLEGADQTALLQVLADASIKGSAIGTLLRNNGYVISDRAVQRYRKEVIWA